jgi:long-chain acyl-CoA synthetase
MNLVTALAESVRKHPKKPALYWGEREYSYPELWKQTVSVGARLRREFGVRPGDRVGLWLKNCPEFIPAFFGILHAGGVVVPINNFLKPNEVGYIIEDSGLEVLITDAELAVHFGALAAARPKLQLLVAAEPWLTAEAEETPDVPRAESDLAVLIYTSGTTGRSKGAMLSHGNLLHNVESCRLVLQVVDLDRLAVMLPMFHSYMLTVGMLLPLLIGGSVVLVKSLHPVRNALQEIVQRQATVLPAIPQFYRSMAGLLVNGPLPIRIFVSGAAPLPAQVLKEFEAKFQRPLIEGYGLSEASPVVTKNPLNGTHKPGSIGLPIPHVEVSIQDDAGRELPAKEIGELCVRGGNVMLGYWQKPEETAKVMRNGWLLTGDIGYRDDEGYYFITDRKKDMLLVNGINVYPREIEEILYQFPGIKEAAVIGRPDPRKGEQPVAYVSLNEGVVLDERAVQSFVRQQLADYKVPKRVILLPALPRNATGKILKTALREMN